jgi:hypothetical protein
MTDDDGQGDEEIDGTDVPHYGSCPACGYVLDDSLDDARVVTPDEEGVIMVALFDCPDCARPLRLLNEKPDEGLGIKMTLEVDRDRLDGRDE